MMDGQERLPFDTKELVAHKEGDIVDLTPDIQPNYDFFSKGPGYEALNM
jgi:hypothetical protein